MPPKPPAPRDRVERIEGGERSLLPFLRAPASPGCELYWISVPVFPPSPPQRQWLVDFLPRLHASLAKEHGLRGEFFLQFKTVTQVEKRFRKLALDALPILGLARKPNAPMPPAPTKEQLEAAARGGSFDITAHYPDYCFWLRNPDLLMLLQEFFGRGGSAIYYLKPDPATKPVEVPHMQEFRQLMPQLPFDKLGSITQAGLAMKDGFLESSKKLFGAGLEQEPEYDGIPYILPLLRTNDFFSQPEPERQKWFQLFDVFWRESPDDKGIYVASKLPLEATLIEILKAMKEAGKVYPER